MTQLHPGDPAPDFALEDANGDVWHLQDLRGKRVVLYFYPADDTPGCTAESCDFRDNYKLFSDANVEVLGVSPQGAESHRRFATKYELNFPLLVDADLSVASAYGAVAEKPGEYKGIPIRLKRSTFVIGPDGNIEQAIYGVKVAGHVDAIKKSIGV